MAAGRGLEGRLHALLQRTPCRPFEDRIRAVPAVLVVMALLMPTGLLARHAAVMQPLARESGTLAACFGSEEAGLLNHESEVRASFERSIPREEPFSHPQP